MHHNHPPRDPAARQCRWCGKVRREVRAELPEADSTEKTDLGSVRVCDTCDQAG